MSQRINQSPTLTSRPSGEGTPLEPYFRNMAKLPLMTADEERSAAERIARGRVELWKAILSYPSFAEPVVEFVATSLAEDDRPTGALRAMARAARTLRDRGTRANREAFEKAGLELATLLGPLDRDAALTDPIQADLQVIEAAHHPGPHLAVTCPPRGSRPFQAYVDRVHRAHTVLWAEKHAFVKANLRLVVTIARRFDRGGMPLPDLIQEGNIGLMKAVDRFDPDRGFRFSTYAAWWIRHAVGRSLAVKARTVRLPVHVIETQQKLRKVRRGLVAEGVVEPTNADLAAAAGVPLEKIEQLERSLLREGPSLDAPLPGGEGEQRTRGDLLEDPHTVDPTEVLDGEVLEGAVGEVLDELRPMEADILRRRFGLDGRAPMTLKEIGAEYSLSRERIRQLQEQALQKVRGEFQRRHLI